MKVSIHTQSINSNITSTQQVCKQQQIASRNTFINKLNVPIADVSTRDHESLYTHAIQCHPHSINITSL